MASRILWRTNSSAKRCCSRLTTPVASSARVLARDAPLAEVHLVESLQLAEKAEGAGRGDLGLETRAGEGEGIGLIADHRKAEIVEVREPVVGSVRSLGVAAFHRHGFAAP